MAFNIDTFKSRAGRHGFLRNNRFEVRIGLPLLLSPSNPNFSSLTSNDPSALDAFEHLRFMCDAVNFPGISLNLHDNRRFGYGAVEKKPTSPVFQDLNIDIIADGKNNNWRLIKKWVQYINNYNFVNPNNTGPGGLKFFEVNYKENYRGLIELVVLSETGFDPGNKARTVLHFKDAFPVSISDVQLNWGDTNNILRFQTSWSYYTWTEITT